MCVCRHETMHTHTLEKKTSRHLSLSLSPSSLHARRPPLAAARHARRALGPAFGGASLLRPVAGAAGAAATTTAAQPDVARLSRQAAAHGAHAGGSQAGHAVLGARAAHAGAAAPPARREAAA